MAVAPSDLAMLGGAVLLAALGGEAFLKAILGAAHHLRVLLACGIVALLFLLPNRANRIVRGRGILLLILYAGFVWATLRQ